MNLNDMLKLETNWDSYGALPVDPKCVEKAKEIIFKGLGGRWDAVPGNDGSVQLEQHCDGFDIEIHIERATPNVSEGL